MGLFTRFIREPLVHFLITGLVLFIAYYATQQQETTSPKQIVVSQGQIKQLAAQFKRVSLRSPSQQELNELIEGYIRDEVFYRQGLLLGLDINDPVVKQRMRMKLEVLLEDLNDQALPSDEALLAYMQEHPTDYMTNGFYSFEHVYIDIAKHESLAEAVANIKQQITDNVDTNTLGDRIILPAKFDQVADYEVIRLFGDEFQQGLNQLTLNQWSDVIYSGYGAHLVKLNTVNPSQLAVLSEVRSKVVGDYLLQRRVALKDNAYQNLRKAYDITIEESTKKSAD